MAQRVFKMNGRKYYSIMDMARELGLPRIYSRDFNKYGIVEITGTPEADEADSAADQLAVTTEDDTKAADTKAADSDENKKIEKKADKKASAKAIDKKPKKDTKSDKPADSKKVYTVDELVKMPIEDFSKYLRKVDTVDVVKFAEDNKIETFEDVSDERIRRMKIVMAIKDEYFPGQSATHKKSSFRKVDLADLIKFADHMGVEYKKCDEEKIQKMWVIYALTQAGFTDMPKTDSKKDDGDDIVED